jgi:hypothetical protein
MSVVSHIHHSQKKKIHHLAKNTHAVDFLTLLSHDELALTIENNRLNNHRERIYIPNGNQNAGFKRFTKPPIRI